MLDYIESVDWIAFILGEDKRGVISVQHSMLLGIFGLGCEIWLSLTSRFGYDYQGVEVVLDELAEFATHTGTRWIVSKSQLLRIMH